MLVLKVVKFFADDEEKYKEKSLHFTVNYKVSQSSKRKLIYLFILK